MGKTIYFIHGAYSAEKIWGDVIRVLSEDNDMREFSHKFTTHTTESETKKGLLSKLFGNKNSVDINSVTNDIVSDIATLASKDEEIYIAVHSLGGLSLRKALPKMETQALEKIVKIIYFDTPSTIKGFNSICNIYGIMEAEEFGVDAQMVEESCNNIIEIDAPYQELMIYAAYGRKIDEESIPKCVKEYEILSLRHPDCCKIDGGKHLGYVAMKKFFLDIKEEAPLKEPKKSEDKDISSKDENESEDGKA